MKIKNVFALLLALCMVFALCACGGNETPKNTDPAPETTQGSANSGSSIDEPTLPESEEGDETPGETEKTEENNEPEAELPAGQVAYTVTVVDEGGNPVAGALVQICLEACFPGVTNAEGKVTYRVEEADYKVSFVSMPAGYTSDVNEFHFEEGKYELTITLKAVA